LWNFSGAPLTRPEIQSRPVYSAQAIFAESAGGHLDALDYRDWDLIGLDELTDFQKYRDIDPVLRAILLQHILQLNQPVALWSGQDEFGKIADALVEQNIEDIEWLDPTHVNDPDVLQKLQSSIDKLSSLAGARTTMLNRRDAILRGVAVTFNDEGILLRKKDGYELVTAATSDGTSTAWALGTDKKLVEIAQLKGKQWSVDTSKAGLVPDGSLVFIIAPAK